MTFGLSDALYKAARDHHEAGRVAEAANGYLQVLAFSPAHFEALHMLAMACGQMGDHAQALHYADQALAVRSSLPETHLNRGYALASLGRDEDARAAFRKAIDLRPGFLQAEQAIGALDDRARKAAEAPSA